MKDVRILSLFDGGSGGNIAAQSLGWNVVRYWASEKDKFAITQTQANFPNTIQLGCIKRLRAYLQAGCSKLLKIQPSHRYYKLAGQCIEILTFGVDMLCGGSPCQGFSSLGGGLNFNDSRSKLFFEFVKIRNIVKPTYFFLENVVMKKQLWVDIISKYIGVLPIKISAKGFTPGERNRYYWTNIKEVSINLLGDKASSIPQPKHKDVLLPSILQPDSETVKYNQSEAWSNWFNTRREYQLKKGYCSINGDKSITLTARMYASWNGQFIEKNGVIRRLTPRECMRLQGWPEHIKQAVSDSQMYKILGNGWQNDVIKYIWGYIE